MLLQSRISVHFPALIQLELLLELLVLISQILESILHVLLLQAHRFYFLEQGPLPVELQKLRGKRGRHNRAPFRLRCDRLSVVRGRRVLVMVTLLLLLLVLMST